MASRTRRRIRYAVVGLGHIAQASVLPAFARAKLAARDSFDAADVSTCRLVGTTGDVVHDPAFSTSEPIGYSVTTEGTTRRHKGRRVDQFAAERVYFSRCILDDVPPEPSAEEGAWDVHIIEALYRSMREGTAIALPAFADAVPHRGQRIALPPPATKPRLVNVQPPHD